jgi:hypothetical protein
MYHACKRMRTHVFCEARVERGEERIPLSVVPGGVAEALADQALDPGLPRWEAHVHAHAHV